MYLQKQDIFNEILRKDYTTGIHQFDKVVEDILLNSGLDETSAESFITGDIETIWNYVLKKHDQLLQRNSKPFIKIKDPYSRKISSYPEVDDYQNNYSTQLIKARPNILRKIDLMNSREYEALTCVACKLLGADKILLTKSGNEGGIDFIATISFSVKSHYFFGINGPIRIIGQSKKYNSKAQDNSIKEFITTLNDVYSLTPKMNTIVPNWFRSAKGIIIGWFITHSGFQSGAISRSNNHGFILSDTLDLAEIISSSKKFFPYKSHQERADSLEKIVKDILQKDHNSEIDLSDIVF